MTLCHIMIISDEVVVTGILNLNHQEDGKSKCES